MSGACPLLKAGHQPNPTFLHEPYACIQDACQWWVHDTDHPDCAVVVRATQPVTIEMNTRVLAWIEKLIDRRLRAATPRTR